MFGFKEKWGLTIFNSSHESRIESKSILLSLNRLADTISHLIYAHGDKV
jgi:hypothetical protein